MKKQLLPSAFILTFSALTLSACGNSWVQLTPAAEQVRVANANQIGACTRIGTANVNALDNIGFVQRGGRQLQEELVSLARNEAGDLQGTHVVPESTINNGRQTFGIYRCP